MYLQTALRTQDPHQQAQGLIKQVSGELKSSFMGQLLNLRNGFLLRSEESCRYTMSRDRFNNGSQPGLAKSKVGRTQPHTLRGNWWQKPGSRRACFSSHSVWPHLTQCYMLTMVSDSDHQDHTAAMSFPWSPFTSLDHCIPTCEVGRF